MKYTAGEGLAQLLHTSRQIELIKYALMFSLTNIDENWEDKFDAPLSILEKELKELIDKFEE